MHQHASTELLELENNELAIRNAISRVKSRLRDAPDCVANDVLNRCDPETHSDLIDWLSNRVSPSTKRLPRKWSPKKDIRTWMLYYAADLKRPANPPRRRKAS